MNEKMKYLLLLLVYIFQLSLSLSLEEEKNHNNFKSRRFLSQLQDIAKIKYNDKLYETELNETDLSETVDATSYLASFDYDDFDDHYYPDYYDIGQGLFFEIRSAIYGQTHDGWCLQELFESSKKNRINAAICNGSPSQKWSLDYYSGYIRNLNHPEKCLRRLGIGLNVGDCSTIDNDKWMKWIFGSDGSFRWGFNTHFAIGINKKYTNAKWLNKKVAQVRLVKINNRLPKLNEQWWPNFDNPHHVTRSPTTSPTVQWSKSPTLEPTFDTNNVPSINNPSPTIAPTLDSLKPQHDSPKSPAPSIQHNSSHHYPTNESTHPVQSPSFPPTDNDRNKTSSKERFHITLMDMGNNTSYNHIFEKTKAKLEKIIVGDLLDQPPLSNPGHDWFIGTWPSKTNIFVDDVLIGYEIGEIDGVGGTLGYAGPIYIRRTPDATGVESVSTISGLMKFEKADFERMTNEDISLVILHEMAHVLGIGTLWSQFKCGISCNETKQDNYYECGRAKDEYVSLFNDETALPTISPKDCAHWSEKSFDHNDSSELMTPYFEKHKYQPLSRVSVAAFADLGYKVNMTAADPLILGFHNGNDGAPDNDGPNHNYNPDGNNTNNVPNNGGTSDNNPNDGYYSGLDRNKTRKLMEKLDVLKPSTTFVLDSSNMMSPEIHIIDVN